MKINIQIIIFLVTIVSCSTLEQEVAKEICDCVNPTLEIIKEEKKVNKWHSSLSLVTQGAILSGQSANNIKSLFKVDVDSTKLAYYRDFKVRSAEIAKNTKSCMNAINDKYEEQIEKDSFKKTMRIELRELCPEAAKQLGI
jgi:hypothetical protein